MSVNRPLLSDSERFASLSAVTDALAGRSLRRPTRDLLQVGALEHALSEMAPGFTLITQPGPRAALTGHHLARAGAIVEARSLDRAELEHLAATAPRGPAVVGVGGGVVMDSAKWLAFRSAAPLVLAPSILSVDACVTNTVAVRDGNQVSYEGFVEADRIVLDTDLVRAAPSRLNRAGAGDLLSIHTALWDWAAEGGNGGAPFQPGVARRATAVLGSLAAVADGVAAVTGEALTTVLLGYADINDLTVQCGHAQMEEGSEHYFAYHLERLTGQQFVHGEVVTLGVVIMSRLQHNDPDWALRTADRCGVQWRPAQLGLSRQLLVRAVTGLARYVHEAGLPRSIADTSPTSERAAGDLLTGLV